MEIDARNKMGLTALTAAAFKGEVDIAKALVEAKADVNIANESGQTSLMFAALAGRKKMVAYLLKVGADPKATDKAGNTPRSLAKGQGAEKVQRTARRGDSESDDGRKITTRAKELWGKSRPTRVVAFV